LLEVNLSFKEFITPEKITEALKWIEELTAREDLPKDVLDTALGVLDELEEGDETSQLKESLQLTIDNRK
jgi:hypothetical protein